MHKTISKTVRTENRPSLSLTTARINSTGVASAVAGLLMVGLVPATGFAQSNITTVPVEMISSAAEAGTVAATLAEPAALPDAPGFSSSQPEPAESAPAAGGFGQTRISNGPEASHFAKTIDVGQTAPRLTIGDKILLGIRENASYTSVGGWLISAAYEQAVDGSPNYGQTGKGFAQRLGAAAARASSENIFSDSVIAPILHQDPRYYRMGSGHPFLKRLVYSGTRGLITRTDGGRTTINFANIGGDLGGSALTQWYYPPVNRSFNEVMQTWGGSIGGDALGYVVAEFFPRGLFHYGHSN